MVHISEEYNSFLWLPPKTGTMRASGIFKEFGFISIEGGNTPISSKNELKFIHNHDIELFDGSENYKLICTGRNPYSKMVSYYKISYPLESNELDKENFLNFLAQYFYTLDKGAVWMRKFKNYWDIRTPDYYIRMENMFEDYLKIPFVKSTEIYKTGELEKMCGIKINENSNKKFWKEYYCDEAADMVYYNNSKYFEKLGYDKNSYKF